MEKFIHDALFGLGFGCGFHVAGAVLQFIAGLISRGATHADQK